MECVQQHTFALGKYAPVLLVDLFDDLIQRLLLVTACRALLPGWLIDPLGFLERDLPVKGLLQLVILQFQLALQENNFSLCKPLSNIRMTCEI